MAHKLIAEREKRGRRVSARRPLRVIVAVDYPDTHRRGGLSSRRADSSLLLSALIMQAPLAIEVQMRRQTIREQVEEMTWLGYSPATIRDELDCNHGTVRYYVRRWRKGMRERLIELPPCRCGAIHEHRGTCIEKRFLERPWLRRPVPDDFTAVAPTMCKSDLQRHYSVSREALSRWLKESPQISAKKRSRRTLRPTGRITHQVADPLFQRIEPYIPSHFSDDIREDLISEVYVAILDGSLTLAELEAEGWRLIGDALKANGRSPWEKSISLDAENESGRALISTLADPAYLEELETDYEVDDW